MVVRLFPLALFLTMFMLISIFPSLSESHPIKPQSSFSPALALKLRSSEQCGFTGNNDIYGIGIRIGIYTQILAVWFANYFLLSQAQVLRDSITIFTVALLAVSFMFVANPASSYAVEAFILLQVLSWSCMMGVRAKSRFSKLTFRNTAIRAIISEAINLCSIILQVWFWWRGLDQMLKTPCGTYIMYLVKTDMYGWVRTVMKTFSLLVLCVTVYWVAIEGTRAWNYFTLRYTREVFEFAVMEFEKAEMKRRLQDRSDDPTDAADHNNNSQSHNGSTISLPEDSIDQSPAEQTALSHQQQTRLEESSMDRVATLVNTGSLESSNPGHRRNSEDTQSASRSKCECQIEVTQTPSILEGVYNGEIYIQKCISAGPYERIKTQEVTITNSIMNILLLRPRPKNISASAELRSRKSDIPSYFTCQFRILKALVTFQFTKQAFVLYTHLRHSRLLDPWNGPYQVYAALFHSNGPIPTSSETALASSLLLTKAPRKVWIGWYYAYLDLAIHILVILQLELTMEWNRIEGLLGIGSVGQLIPFITGVAGLGLVGGRWVERWHKRRRGKDVQNDVIQEEKKQSVVHEDGIDGLDNSVVAAYYRWKETYEMTTKEDKPSPDAQAKIGQI